MSEVLTVLEAIQKTTEFFRKKNIPEPKLAAELLLMSALNIDKIKIYTQFDKPLSEAEKNKYRNFAVRRAAGEPVQYISGEAYFMGLKFRVDRSVLIPRFDTEVLCEKLISTVREKNGSNKVKIIDIGTGSGCIAIACAKFLPNCEVIALDISREALALAKKNAELNGVDARIEFLESDLLQELVHRQITESLYVVSNPPYVNDKDYAYLAPEVKNFEPKQALWAEENGCYYYRQILGQISIFGPELKGVFLEVGYDQAAEIQKMLHAKYHQEVFKIKDIGGIERVVYTLL